MNINDFKFYRKNNRYYFESDLLEGQMYIHNKEVYNIKISNGSLAKEYIWELIDRFNANIAAVLEAEEV